ncbi:hypothetical protein BKP64_10810 [Marinobacter salinus]|uniref:Uncharacterized protein n=1 Tax=Marinobacter salinus TaxID=1874317 RepID=A0A1D9GLV3_9GAMM|nr:hypothetical protein BKP64_10810 [Marinobacter salinus]
MNRTTTDAHIASNVHPNYRELGLSSIRQIRLYGRSPWCQSSRSEIKELVKAEQRSLARKRALLKSAEKHS